MKNADRFLGIIYNYISIENLIIDSDLSEPNQFNATKEIFDLKNIDFRARIIHTYMQMYPGNYSEDVIYLLLNEQIEIIENKYNSSNSLYLFLYYAEELFCIKNNQFFIDFDKLLEWDGFINKVDLNIFYAAYLSVNENKIDKKKHRHTSIIKNTNSRLDNLLKQGVSENHMHLEASGYGTEMNLYYFLTEYFFDEKVNFSSHIEEKFGSYSKDNSFATKSIHYKVKEKKKSFVLKKLLLCRLFLFDFLENNPVFNERDYMKIILSKDIESIERYISGIKSIQENMKVDIQKITDPKFYLEVEREFIAKWFSKIKLNKCSSFIMIYLFNLYLYGITKFRFQAVQDNRGIGFSKFAKKNKLKSKWMPSNAKSKLYDSVFDKYYSDKHVKYVEIRMGIKRTENLIEIINHLDNSNTSIYKNHCNNELIKYGIILHFSKPKVLKNNLKGFRYQEQYEEIKEDSLYIHNFFDKNNNSEYYTSKLIGIDAANNELSIRPEFFGPIFRELRSISSKKSKLNFTFHVGEEFNTLCSGLGAIDEVLEFLYFQRGDRLGHALALGIDIDQYINSKRGFITTSVEEYLDNIVWLYSLLSKNNTDNSRLLEFLKKEFHDTKFELFNHTNHLNVSLYDYLDSYLLRGDYPEAYISLAKQDKPFRYRDIVKENNNFNYKNKNHEKSFNNKNARELYYAYHYDKELKKNGAKVKILEVNELYISSLKIAQRMLKEKIVRKEISIEVNPSSNKKISSVNRYIDLPFIQMNQLYLEHSNFKKMDINIPISINTDDSSIFQTSLVNEYSLVALALIKEGYERESVYRYIEYLRVSSIDQNFLEE